MNESVGGQLRAAREARGWSVEEVAGRLKISARYVNALEGGDAAALPEPTFVRGYIKAYAKAVALDADALLAASAPVEVKAPRPLIGPEGQVGASRKMKATARGPSFRAGSSFRMYQIAGGVLLVAVVVWLALPGTDKTVVPAVEPVAAEPPVAPAIPAAGEQVPVVGGVTLAVPLPGPASEVAAPVSLPPATTLPATTVPAALSANPVVVAATAATTTTALAKLPVKPGVVAAAATPAAIAATNVTPAAAVAPPVATAPRKGLFARFSGTCWVEVRDADNVVVHTRIAMAGNEMSVDGKAPLTLTLGDASAAEVWYNGDRVAADKFSSNGIARIIVGQSAR